MSATGCYRPRVLVIGAGPAGLMAAESLAQMGLSVEVYDAMPSVGRKFLLAGIGGLNLTHSEPIEQFVRRFDQSEPRLRPILLAHGPRQICDWAAGLGVKTFVGSSGRIFPEQMKAAPLLRAWLHRLRSAGVRLHMRHRWTGWNDARQLVFTHRDGRVTADSADAVVLALGGASWPRLGSDAAWVELLSARGVRIAPLAPANCGFDIGWSTHFAEKFAGAPLKPVVMTVSTDQSIWSQQGELVVTSTGIEGSLVYAASAMLRQQIAERGSATLHLDLMPGRTEVDLATRLSLRRSGRSLSEHWRVSAGLAGAKANLVREIVLRSGQDVELLADHNRVASLVKRLPLTLVAPRPIAEAISSAGGVCWSELDCGLMLHALPGVFCAGEMIDWEAPTGGYLLSACLATGSRAAQGVRQWLETANPRIAEGGG